MKERPMFYLLDFPIPTTDLSLAGIVTLVVMLVLFGGLIPRWTHKERVKDKEAENQVLQQIIAKRDEQHAKLVENDQLIIKLLEDIKTEGRGGRRRVEPP
jgi:hypothetical protein